MKLNTLSNTAIKVMPSLPAGEYGVKITAIAQKKPDPQKEGYLQVDFNVVSVVALVPNADGTVPANPSLVGRTGSLQIFPKRLGWSLTQLVDKTNLGVELTDTDQLVGKDCNLFFVHGYEDTDGVYVLKKQWNLWA